MLKLSGMMLSVATCVAPLAAFALETPFAQPSIEYMKKFVQVGKPVFVYERYDAKGQLFSRDVTLLTAPVTVVDATTRRVNNIDYKLRGLVACPSQKITYQTEEWDCTKAAIDSQTMVYNRASVTLCKTLALKTEAGRADPVSCFSLVGDGSSNDPFNVSYDDDDLVFLGMAAIGKNNKGQSLRPDLQRSAELGTATGHSNAIK